MSPLYISSAICYVSYGKSIRLSVTRWHCVKTTPATIMGSSLEDSPHDSSFLMVNFSEKFQREHRQRGRRIWEG